MILVFGGTTEGRVAVKVLEEAAKPFYYSTKGNLQKLDLVHGIAISGAMDSKELVEFINNHGVSLIINAAHPFAIQLHANINNAAKQTNTEVVRLDRIYPKITQDVIKASDYIEANKQLAQWKGKRVLFLTGVQTIPKFKTFWSEESKSFFRILNREESFQLAQQFGFPKERLVYYEKAGQESKLLKQITPDLVVTKESGISGGLMDKIEASQKVGIPLLMITRPKLPESWTFVDGPNGLRRAIEFFEPEFFELHTGLTTGSHATAATKAALYALLGTQKKQVSITLPNGEHIMVAIDHIEKNENSATASLFKKSGDDPDVTNGKEIGVKVSFCEGNEVKIIGGKGVGTVTLPGLGLPIGGPAINIGPQQMIRTAIQEVFDDFELAPKGVCVEIFIPEGETLAKLTFNPKLGVVGGISIIGTSGIIRPFSSEAFIASIRKELQVAKALGSTHAVINSGAKSQRVIQSLFPQLQEHSFVHYGNFIGETLQICSELGFKQVSMGIMIGKAVKLAEGFLDTHSKKVTMNKSFIRSLAQEAGCSSEKLTQIETITMARELWKVFKDDNDQAFFSCLLKHCFSNCRKAYPKGIFELFLINEKNEIAVNIKE